jgi:hypothetical protein
MSQQRMGKADLFELVTLDPAGAETRTLFSDVPMRPFSHFDPDRPDADVLSRVQESPTFGQDLYVDPDRGAGDVAVGAITLDDTDGALGWLSAHAMVSLIWLRGWPGDAFAAWDVVATARPQAPRRVTSDGDDAVKLIITLYDRRLDLNDPIQTNVMAGDAVGPTGLGGAADLKDQPIPLVLGDLSTGNITPPVANASLQIWRVHDGAGAGPLGAVNALYHRGGPAGLADAGDLGAGLAGATLTGGQYARSVAAGLVRCGANVSGELTMGVTGPAAAGTTAPALIMWALARRYGGGVALGDEFVNPAALSSATLGTYVTDSGVSYADLIDGWCASAGMWCVPDERGVWRAGVHGLPGEPAATINAYDIVKAETEDGEAPVCAVTVKWGRNHKVLGRGSIAEILHGGDREAYLAVDWRRETYPDAATAAAIKSRHINARKVEVTAAADIRYQADAAALAQRLFGLLSLRPDGSPWEGWRVAVSMDAWSGVRLGTTVTLDWAEGGVNRPVVVLGRRLGSPEPGLMWLRVRG